MYLPLLTEILILSLERVSLMYNRTSSAILKLLPTTFSIENSITSFETDSFFVKGEVTYKTLKVLLKVFICITFYANEVLISFDTSKLNLL